MLLTTPKMTESSTSLRRGSCLCGQVSFELESEPFKVLQCYCLDCQKGAGGPFQIVRVAALQGFGFQESSISPSPTPLFLYLSVHLSPSCI